MRWSLRTQNVKLFVRHNIKKKQQMSTNFSIEAALLGLPPDMQQRTEERLVSFANNLWNRYRMPVRDDSRLVWSLAVGNLPSGWTEERVMDELCLMRYIHECTPYMARFKTTIPVVKQNIEQQVFKGHPHASSLAYEYVQKFVIPVYRIRSMLETHPDHGFPTVWPWVNAEEQEHEEHEEKQPQQHPHLGEQEDNGDDDEEEDEEEDLPTPSSSSTHGSSMS